MPSKYVPKNPYELWSQKKRILHHFHVWGCKVEVRPFNSQSKKLDLTTISGYFISYCVGSRGSMFYCPSHTTRVIESDRAIYFEDDTGTRQGLGEIVFKEHQVFILVPIASALISSHIVDQHLVTSPNNEPIEDVDPIALDVDLVAPNVVMNIPLRRSERARRPVIQMITLSTYTSICMI